MTTGQKIYECRKRAGLTQEELAEQLNVSRQAVSKWEADAAFPETEKILALCRLFSLSADELLFGGASPASVAADAQTSPCKRNPKAAGKILHIAENICAFLAALAAFVFTFCIGFTIRGDAADAGAPALPHSLFYYFGGAYSDVAWLIGQQGELYSRFAPLALYASAVFGTVAAALTLFSVTFFFVRTLRRAIVGLRCHTGTNPTDALLTYLCFLAGTLLLCSVTGVSSAVTRTSEQLTATASARSALNGATVAGICLGAIFLAGSFACALFRAGADGERREMLLHTGFAIAKTGLCLALLILFAMPLLQVTKFNAQTSEKWTTGLGIGQALYLAGLFVIRSFGTSAMSYDSHMEYFFQTFGFCIASYLLLIALAVLTIISVKRISQGMHGQPRRTFGLLLATALVSLVLGFLFTADLSLVETLWAWAVSGHYGVQFGGLIATAVLALALLAAAVAERIVLRRLRQKHDTPPESERAQ